MLAFYGTARPQAASVLPSLSTPERCAIIGEVSSSQAKSRGSTPLAPGSSTYLPSRTSVYQTMRLEASGEMLEKIKRADRVRFVASVVPRNERIAVPLRRWTPYEHAPPWPIHQTAQKKVGFVAPSCIKEL
jgi:hypothetical protein